MPLKEDLVSPEVGRAKNEILVLDLLSAAGRRPDTFQDDRLEPYYSDLIKRVADGVQYRRILQVANPVIPVSCLPDTPFRKHCREACKMREEKRNWNASIRVARR